MRKGDLMNPYLKNLSKIEFVITNACTGKCKHCSEGSHTCSGENIDSVLASKAVESITKEYDIKTVMTFGGEPLLYPETVYAIMESAKKMKVLKRQVITNGCFSKNSEKIHEVAKNLSLCGVNELLLSVDAFHQETIPLDIVRNFAKELKKYGVPTKLQPAWLVSRVHENEYNIKTREILDNFRDLELYENEGNIVFPEGNAVKYFSEYFTDSIPENPYVENPADVRCVSFSPNGDVLSGNIYKSDISDILSCYSV